MNKSSKLNAIHKGSKRLNQNKLSAQIFIKTPAGRILFQSIKLGYLMRSAKYRGKNDRLSNCKFIYYSQADFPKKIRLRLCDINRWSDSSIKNVIQKLLKQSELDYSYAKSGKIKNPAQYYETTRNLLALFEVIKNMPGLFARITEFVNAIIITYQQSLTRILRSLDRKLIEIGWPPSVRLTPQESIELTVGGQRLTTAQIEKYLLKKFNNEIFSEMLSDWANNKIFADRIHILKDAISAHNAGKYTLSIPILLAQCEGLIVSIVNLKGRKTQSDMINEINRLSKNAILYESFMNILTNSFLEQFKFGQNEFYGLGRNSILHGINIAYATPENSLKSILLIDFLFEISKSVQKNNEEGD
jgi:predicted DNA-binding transcriptional regulator AlpA